MSPRYLMLVFLLCVSQASAGGKAARPQEPKKPYPYRVEEVSVEREDGAVKLAASLTLPKGDGPFAAVVLIAAPGAYDRDSTHDGHKPYLVLADALTRQGLVVLRYDQRGTGKSTGNWAKVDGPAFIEDTRAALNYLRGRKDIDPAKVGLLGHGEGGIVARLVAADRKEAAWLILVSAPEEGAGSPFGKVDFFKAKLEAFLRASAAPDRTGSWLFRAQARILETVRVRPKLESL